MKACPTDAWDAKSGYLVSFGGLFGNRIHKGEEILPVIESEEDLFRVTDAAIQFLMITQIQANVSDLQSRELAKINL